MLVGRLIRVALPMTAVVVLGLGCQTGLEVKFADAGKGETADSGPPSSDGGAGSDGDAGRPPPPFDAGSGDAGTPDELGACPCDPNSGGLGCCLLPGRAPFCSSAVAPCVQAGGLFHACAAYDPGTDSQCCWNLGPVAGGSTTFSTACGQRTVACVTNSDCAGSTCRNVACRGYPIGACGVEPVCP